MGRVSFAGIEIDNLTIQETINEIEELIQKEESSYIVTPNVAHIVLLQKDKEFKKIYQGARLVIADGMPLLWGAKVLGRSLKERVAGSDLLPTFCKSAAKKGYRLFFLGARPGIAARAAEILTQKNRGLRITGTYSPPFGFENDEEENGKIVRMIREAKPDVLFVGLGAPKQEKWIWKYRNRVEVPVSVGVGITFDFIAGTVKRAPLWMQRYGLEWVFRLCQEPGRLWKRYLIGNPIFIWLVLKEFIKVRILVSHKGLEDQKDQKD